MEEPKRVLVIEDDPILRELLAEWLLAAGYGVGVAAGGGAGPADARAHRPALVVTDIHMPRTRGAAGIFGGQPLYPGVPRLPTPPPFRSQLRPSPEQADAHAAEA